ncbi:DUF2165 family protein [Seohaeicola zhoushanensis]|uniref:DUF2165 family protein n=1 Tax=Seohaeicola zhoushanensis TaxID=1569283 RepID=A0A8J3GWA4_9RHOB|nr:DUF2165 family protein [Seohaeicola zhoushanensis]GHF47943.1 hypothetical protein GCM10017056_19320 [Seohaeicola zhoushanensis]
MTWPLLLDAALVGSLGLWMAVAVADNWRIPALNRQVLAQVLRLELMERDYPEAFALVADRRVRSERTIDLLFGFVRWAETIAAVLLLGAALLLAAAAAGMAAAGFASVCATLATAFFALVWAGFIIGGNYYCYWYCHQSAQANHFMLLFWGLGVLLVLMR